EFFLKHMRNFAKRIFYNYYLRDMSVASIELPLGVFLLAIGTLYGSYNWTVSAASGVATTAGTVMLAALPILAGIQLLLGFIGYDVTAVPTRAIHPNLRSPLHPNG